MPPKAARPCPFSQVEGITDSGGVIAPPLAVIPSTQELGPANMRANPITQAAGHSLPALRAPTCSQKHQPVS